MAPDPDQRFQELRRDFNAALDKRDSTWREDNNCLRRAISGLQNRAIAIETEMEIRAEQANPFRNKTVIVMSLGGGGVGATLAGLVMKFL